MHSMVGPSLESRESNVCPGGNSTLIQFGDSHFPQLMQLTFYLAVGCVALLCGRHCFGSDDFRIRRN
jgi:hypothetical protein